ncbi:MAG TPA: Gfo/Idh/MocA family oxidoreductase [Fimbriimonadaceae bacterium]|nr:Gfo/Idh/MocA family oxidoreductase [Fimbriimonadaceae bacterium]
MAKKLKIGLIGTGMICNWAHIPGYERMADDCEMVWACDLIEEKAKDVAAKHNIPKVTTDYHDILSDPEIDAVSVMTPNIAHMQPTIDALNAGKHVLCEKPLSMNADQSRKMCAAARDNGKLLQVGLQQRFTSEGQFLKQYIDTGALGDIYYARAQALRRRGVPGWGVFTNKELQGGGPLIDIGVHILDFTLTMMGYPKPVSASGMTWNMLGTNPNLYNAWGDYDRSKFTVEDMAIGFIRFDNDAVVVLESSFMSNLNGNPYGTQLFGTKGGAKAYFEEEKPLEIYTEVEKQLFNMTPANLKEVQHPHREEVESFINSIKSGAKKTAVPGEQGLILNAIFDALYKSAETRTEEKIDVTF